MDSIGSRIRAAREALDPKVSQAELARRIGVGQVQMYKWESGRRVPRLDTLERLADQLGVTIDYLVRGARAGDDSEAHTA